MITSDDFDDVLNESDSDSEEPHPLIVPATRTRFYNSVKQQKNLSFRSSLIHYIAKNPLSQSGYLKLIQTCKFFFIKNPIILASMFYTRSEDDKWFISVNDQRIDLAEISSPVWITDEVNIASFSNTWEGTAPREPAFVSSIMPRIYKSDVTQLILWHHNILFEDLILLASKCDTVSFSRVTVTNEDGSIVALENVIKAFPQLVDFYYFSPDNADERIFSPKTIEEMVNIPHFTNLSDLVFHGLPQIFDINKFYDYIKGNTKTKIELEFREDISDEYQNRLQQIVNEIVATKYHDYRIPMIKFQNMDPIQYQELSKMFN